MCLCVSYPGQRGGCRAVWCCRSLPVDDRLGAAETQASLQTDDCEAQAEKSNDVFLFVTLDHKTSHKGQCF